MLAANPAHRAPSRGSAEIAAARGRPSTASPTRNAALRRTSRARVRDANERIEQETQPPRGAHVGAHAERDRVQQRGPHPALQRARDAAPAQAARRRGRRRRRRTAWSGSGARSSRSSIATSSSTRWTASTTGCAQGIASPVANFVTTAPGRPARARAARAGTGRATDAAATMASDRYGLRAAARQHHAPDRDRQPARPAAADADAGHARVARQHARRRRDDRVVSRHGQGDAQTASSASSATRRGSSRARSSTQTVGEFADSLRTEWPLEDMRGADLIAAARRRIETALALPTKLETVDEAIWLNVDSYSLMQAITYLVRRLRDEFGIREIRFGLEAAGPLAHLDLIWTGAPLGSETTMAWQTDAMELGGEAVPADAEARSSSATRRRSGTRSTSRRTASSSAIAIPHDQARGQRALDAPRRRRKPAGVLRLRPVPPARTDRRARRPAARHA